MSRKEALVTLAAGRGSRMGSLTFDSPKTMLSVKGLSLLRNQITLCEYFNLDHVVVGGYCHQQLICPNANLIVNAEFEFTNMVYSLHLAKQALLSYDTIYVSYGDIGYNLSVLEALRHSSSPFGLVADRLYEQYWRCRFTDPVPDLETFDYDINSSQIIDIGRGVTHDSMPTHQYIGLFKLNNKELNLFYLIYECLLSADGYPHKAAKELDMTSFLQILIEKGIAIEMAEIKGGWFEIDREVDLVVAESMTQVHQGMYLIEGI